MIWGVCWRILRTHHDAEDAFQATFLVLVRKAGSARKREMVGNWLYGVAHQTALKARATAAKRFSRERQVVDMSEPAVKESDRSCDLQAFLDQELSRLPDKYRVGILLCDLEGKTRKEAARQLGLPEGTLAGRLTGRRAVLAKRLARYGRVGIRWHPGGGVSAAGVVGSRANVGDDIHNQGIPGVGPRDGRFKALPPGDNLQFDMGAGRFFDKPGVYRVYWQGEDFRSNEVVFRVTR